MEPRNTNRPNRPDPRPKETETQARREPVLIGEVTAGDRIEDFAHRHPVITTITYAILSAAVLAYTCVSTVRKTEREESNTVTVTEEEDPTARPVEVAPPDVMPPTAGTEETTEAEEETKGDSRQAENAPLPDPTPEEPLPPMEAEETAEAVTSEVIAAAVAEEIAPVEEATPFPVEENTPAPEEAADEPAGEGTDPTEDIAEEPEPSPETPRESENREQNLDLAAEMPADGENSPVERKESYPPISMPPEQFRAVCEKYGVSEALVLALIECESNFDPTVVSRSGDYGLMQINRCNLSDCRALMGGDIDILDPATNITCGVWLFSRQLEAAGGDTTEALMRYNCGPTGARRKIASGITETAYTRKVEAAMARWEAAGF